MLTTMTFRDFLKASLIGIAQVIFINNVWTGMLFLGAIAVYSPLAACAALLSSMLATLLSRHAGAEDDLARQGIFSFSAVLTGLALILFLDGPFRLPLALLGAAITTILTATMTHLLRHAKLPVLTFPFIITTWLFLLAARSLDGIRLAETVPVEPVSLQIWQGAMYGIGQIFLLPSMLSSLLILLGLFVGGWRFGVYAMLSSLIAVLTAVLFGGEADKITMGIYGFNSVLTMLAVALVFHENHRFAFLAGILGSIFTVLLTVSMVHILEPFDLPTFTMPFVLMTWLLLGAMRHWKG